MIENYQTHVLGPDENVDYVGEMKSGYRPEQLQMEPMVGMRILVKDLNCHIASPLERFRYIEQMLNQSGVLRNTGCVIRETKYTEAPDGFWVITFPVPLSFITKQLMNLANVLTFLSTQLGIVSTDICEINVSGHCGYNETEARLSRITLGPYTASLIEPSGTPYKMGHVVRINDYFVILRTLWDFSKGQPNQGRVSNRFNELTIIPQLLAAAFH